MPEATSSADGSKIFSGFRALGYVCDHLPISIRRHNVQVCVAVGHFFTRFISYHPYQGKDELSTKFDMIVPCDTRLGLIGAIFKIPTLLIWQGQDQVRKGEGQKGLPALP